MLVLSLLSREEMYGYQMITELARRSDHTFELKEGTLYPILHMLEAERLVTVREKEAETGRMRKYYRITDAGQQRIADFKDAWKEILSIYQFVTKGAKVNDEAGIS